MEVTFKIETSWAKKVAKSILGTWNVNDLIVCFVYLFSDKKNMQCKKKQF